MTVAARDVPVGEVRFRLYTSGEASRSPLLWLHGGGPGASALGNWEALLEDFSADFFNLAPDIAGFADSTHPDPPPEGLGAFTAFRVKTLIGLLDELDVARVDVVGIALGATIALCMALAHPQRVRRLVLLGPGGAPVPLTRTLISVIRFYDDPTPEALTRLFSQLVADPAHWYDTIERTAFERISMATRPDVERSHRATFSAAGEPLPIDEERMRTIEHPVLLIHGTADRLTPLEASEWFASALPNARLEVVDGAGHWLQMEQPDRFTELVRAFLR